MKTWRFVQYWRVVYTPYIFVFYLLCIIGCAPNLSPLEQVRKFEKAGPVTSTADADSSGRVKTHIGPYRVMTGDILEFQMKKLVKQEYLLLKPL